MLCNRASLAAIVLRGHHWCNASKKEEVDNNRHGTVWFDVISPINSALETNSSMIVMHAALFSLFVSSCPYAFLSLSPYFFA